jgi:hypothetical protein
MKVKAHSRHLLRALMTRYALNCIQVARAMRVRPQTVRAWRCGARPMSEERRKRLVKLYPLLPNNRRRHQRR